MAVTIPPGEPHGAGSGPPSGTVLAISPWPSMNSPGTDEEARHGAGHDQPGYPSKVGASAEALMAALAAWPFQSGGGEDRVREPRDPRDEDSGGHPPYLACVRCIRGRPGAGRRAGAWSECRGGAPAAPVPGPEPARRGQEGVGP